MTTYARSGAPNLLKRVQVDPARAVVAGPIQRCGRVMGIVPNDGVNILLVGAVLMVQHEHGLLTPNNTAPMPTTFAQLNERVDNPFLPIRRN